MNVQQFTICLQNTYTVHPYRTLCSNFRDGLQNIALFRIADGRFLRLRTKYITGLSGFRLLVYCISVTASLDRIAIHWILRAVVSVQAIFSSLFFPILGRCLFSCLRFFIEVKNDLVFAYCYLPSAKLDRASLLLYSLASSL